MLDDEAFGALRRAATLAHAVPPMRVRVLHEGRVLLDVARGHHPEAADLDRPPTRDGDGTLRLPPCAFRVAVGRAHQMRGVGRPLGLLGVPDGVLPQIDVGLPTGGEAWPGGIYQVLEGRRWLYLFATTLSVERCRAVMEGGVLDGARAVHPATTGAVRIAFHGDEATEVTLVHTHLPLGADAPHHSRTRALLGDLLAACATEELMDHLGVPT